MTEKSAVPLTHAERGRKAQALRTPERRREIASQGHLAASVAAVVNRAPDLTPDQLARLRALFVSETSEVVAVTAHRLKYLEDRDQWLECLESAGVDNWGGYEIALEIKNGLAE